MHREHFLDRAVTSEHFLYLLARERRRRTSMDSTGPALRNKSALHDVRSTHRGHGRRNIVTAFDHVVRMRWRADRGWLMNRRSHQAAGSRTERRVRDAPPAHVPHEGERIVPLVVRGDFGANIPRRNSS